MITMNRRNFITGLAATTVATRFASETKAALADSRPLGIQLYTLRNEMQEDFEGTLARVAELGFKEVEVFNLYGRTAKQVRAIHDRHGLVAPSTHTLIKPLKENLPALLDDCQTLGHRYLTVAFLMPNERKTLDDYRGHIETLQRASEECHKAGVQLAYHNHDFEFVPIDGQVPYDMLIANTTAEQLVLELDLYWISKAGHEPLAYLAKDPSRYPLVHVKDMAKSEAQEDTEVGSGVIDFKSIFASDAASGIQHLLVEQDTIKGDRWKSVETSLRGLRRAL